MANTPQPKIPTGDQPTAAATALWVPVESHLTTAGASVRWQQFNDCDFARPFYRQAIEMALQSQPRPPERRTTLDELQAQYSASLPTPAGLIFHMSRCGSTLVSRMLAARGDTLVISEPDPINDILGPYWRLASEHDRRRALRLVLAAFDGLRRSDQNRYLVKFSNWNASYLASLLVDLRGVPKVFVYRDPVEVLVSLVTDPPEWAALRNNTRAASLALGIPPAEVAAMDVAEFCARFVRESLDAVLARFDRTWLLINYADLPGPVYEAVPSHFAMSPDAERAARMSAILGVHSRDRFMAKPFADDREAKRNAATDSIRAAAARWLAEPYARIEALRLQSLTPTGS